MATGLTRREGTSNRLAGQAGVEPVLLNGPGLQTPTALRAPDLSYGTHIANELAKWSGGKLKVKADEKNASDQMAGQVAFQQGQTLDDIQMGGNKWALDGYRVMDAQVASSTLFGAQRQKIAETGYEATPDQFRDTYVAGIDEMTKDMDPTTAKLVRENMLKQMPTLVEDHTVQHMKYLEGQNYDSLERSVDVISRDPTATGELISFAKGGEGSASAGLSDARRQAATVSGVIRAFDGDNPLAYASLSKEGLLADNLTTDEQNSIKAAKGRFEQRRRTERNDALMLGEQDIISRVSDGSLSYALAAEEMSVLYTDHDITMNAADSGALYSTAQAGERTARQTRGTLIEEAGLRGDRETQANIIMDSLIGTESGGNKSAHRTNTDGRSFGGLVQMGQARLDEVTAMMGIPSLSVADYTAMSANDQKGIANRHFVDLIEAAEATGAIGTQIGGVTVTLSGLVAVGHLGGKGGMQKFVSSGGEYNPADQLGTSLTDYLSKHGSGAMEEMFTPEERQQNAEDRLTDTRERLAIDTYESMAPRMADNDDAFKNGVIDEATWRRQNGELYAEYDVARTKADVDHEIGVTRSVDAAVEAAAKGAGDEAYKLRLEGALAATAGARQQWDDVVNNPASTPEEVQAATAAYAATRQTHFDEAGIKSVDRGNGAETERMVKMMSGGMKAHRKWNEEDTRIDAAVNGGYLSDLNKDLQQRAFDKNQAEIVQTYTDAVATGEITADQANSGIAADMTAFYAQAGVVDPTVTMRASANMLQPLTDKDGNPNPLLVDTVAQYQALKMLNPRAADTMLKGEGMARAEAILSRAGGNPDMLPDAVRALGIEAVDNPLRKTSDAYIAQPEVQEAIGDAVYNLLSSKDIGVWQTMQADTDLSQWGDSSKESMSRLWDNEGRLTAEVAEEVGRLHQKTPGIKATDLVARATENVMRRTEIIGGDMVQVPRGQDIGQMFFGDRANEFMHDGAVNSAVMDWLRTDEVRAQYPFIEDTTMAEQLPGFVQGGIDMVAQAIPFMDLEFKPGLSMRDSISVGLGGVRPFRTTAAPNGSLMIQVIKADGNWSDPIVLPTKEIGALALQRNKERLTE